jgi:hypothetical protein
LENLPVDLMKKKIMSYGAGKVIQFGGRHPNYSIGRRFSGRRVVWPVVFDLEIKVVIILSP